MLTHDQLLVNLIHDLSQPLGNIETSAYCLDRCIDQSNPRAQQYLRLIQQQLEQATGILAAAAAQLSRERAHSPEPAPVFEMAATASS